jgi:hypothetical protein
MRAILHKTSGENRGKYIDMNFRPIAIDDCELFDKYSSDDINYENNFAVLFAWNAIFPYEVCEFENALIVKLTVDGNTIFDIPKTKDINLDKYVLFAADYCRKKNTHLCFKILARDYENLSPQIKSDFIYEPIPHQWDYIYKSSDLITFQGRKFQKKRNLLSQFLRNYQYDFIDYDKQKHYDEILVFQNLWSKDDEENYEFPAVKFALDNLEKLNLNCDIIEIAGKIAAFSISNIHHNTGEVIFEKGDTNFKGIYAAIVNFTAKKRFAGCAFINREEDMGIENLRKAKLALNPIKQIEKYLIHFKD